MISAFDSATGLPISSVMSVARSSARSTSSSKAFQSTPARSFGAESPHSFWVSTAASSAAMASSGVPSATSQIGSSVAGSITSSVPQALAEVVGRVAAPGGHAEALGELHEVGVREVGPEVAAELLVLLPDDRAVLAVLPDHVHERRADPDGGLELLAVHEEAAVAVHRHDVALRVDQLGRHGRGHREAHPREPVRDQHGV